MWWASQKAGGLPQWPNMQPPSLNCESDALLTREEPLVSADVDALPVIVESDRHGACVAQVTLDGCHRHRIEDAFDAPVARRVDRLGSMVCGSIGCRSRANCG